MGGTTQIRRQADLADRIEAVEVLNDPCRLRFARWLV